MTGQLVGRDRLLQFFARTAGFRNLYVFNKLIVATHKNMAEQQRTFDTSIGSLYAKVELASDNDRCMIFCPSLFTDHTLFAEVAEELLSNPDFSTMSRVFLDPPGHGQSSFQGKKLEFKDCARAVSEILDQLNCKRCIFVGCAWGGLVGIHFASTYPDRVFAMVSLIIMERLPSFRYSRL